LAALLFCRHLSDTLIEWGFKPNDYDIYVANKMINRKQCTIIWHVNDLKISYIEKEWWKTFTTNSKNIWRI